MIYKSLIKPLLFQLDPEVAHHVVFDLTERSQFMAGWVAGFYPQTQDPRLQQSFWGYAFQNPVGIAAGFDKNLRITGALRKLGFGFMEAGSISALPWPGNAKPRLFRLPQDQAIINRMGLNNLGVQALQPRIASLPADWPVGISLVKTPDAQLMGQAGLDEFIAAYQAVAGYGAYVCLNISCPNTEEGKTFEDPETLETLLSAIRQVGLAEATKKARPLLLKLSPDLTGSQLQEIVEIGCRFEVAGWVVSNTTSGREGLRTHEKVIEAIGRGGLSGQPLRHKSTRLLGELYYLTRHQPDTVLIGVGGINDADSAWEKISHGANLIQVYTGLIYEGPGLLNRINQGILEKLDTHQLPHIRDAVGLAFR